MFFGCLPCCGEVAGACPNHDNLGIVGPLAVDATARLVQAEGLIPRGPTNILIDEIDTGYIPGDSQFIFTYQTSRFTSTGQLIITSPKFSASGNIRTNASLFLPRRGVGYPFVRVNTVLFWQGNFLPTLTARFTEIPCRQNVSPQADNNKTTMAFLAQSSPGGADSIASLFSINSASVHGGDLFASAPFPAISGTARSPSEPAELGFSISGDRSSNPSGSGELTGAPGSLPWQLSFSAYYLAEPVRFGGRVASTFSVNVSSITDANGASASVSAFAPFHTSIPAGPALIP